MTYSDMIFAMDTGINYSTSKRGRKSYKKENEVWHIIICTNLMTYNHQEYCKTKKDGEKWAQWKINEVKRHIKMNNTRAAKYAENEDDYITEQITSITIERTDRMNVKTIENVDC